MVPPPTIVGYGAQQNCFPSQRMCESLVCFMMLCCTPVNRLDYVQVLVPDGQGHDWKIYGIQTGYINEIMQSKEKYNIQIS